MLYPVLNLTGVNTVLMSRYTKTRTGHLDINITFTDDFGILASIRGGSIQNTDWDEQVAEMTHFLRLIMFTKIKQLIQQTILTVNLNRASIFLV